MWKKCSSYPGGLTNKRSVSLLWKSIQRSNMLPGDVKRKSHAVSKTLPILSAVLSSVALDCITSCSICRIPLFAVNCRGLMLHLKIYGNTYCTFKIKSVSLLLFLPFLTFCCVEQMCWLHSSTLYWTGVLPGTVLKVKPRKWVCGAIMHEMSFKYIYSLLLIKKLVFRWFFHLFQMLIFLTVQTISISCWKLYSYGYLEKIISEYEVVSFCLDSYM